MNSIPLKETQGNMYEGYTLINTFQVPEKM